MNAGSPDSARCSPTQTIHRVRFSNRLPFWLPDSETNCWPWPRVRPTSLPLVVRSGPKAHIEQRVHHIKSQASERLGQVELGFTFFKMSMDNRDDLWFLDTLVPDTKREMATLLDGSVAAAAERIAWMRELGISHLTCAIYDSTSTSGETLKWLVAPSLEFARPDMATPRNPRRGYEGMNQRMRGPDDGHQDSGLPIVPGSHPGRVIKWAMLRVTSR
jgi:hypothetical protein